MMRGLRSPRFTYFFGKWMRWLLASLHGFVDLCRRLIMRRGILVLFIIITKKSHGTAMLVREGEWGCFYFGRRGDVNLRDAKIRRWGVGDAKGNSSSNSTRWGIKNSDTGSLGLYCNLLVRDRDSGFRGCLILGIGNGNGRDGDVCLCRNVLLLWWEIMSEMSLLIVLTYRGMVWNGFECVLCISWCTVRCI